MLVAQRAIRSRNIGTTSGWTARAEPAYAPGSVLSLMFAEA